jgi:hypothetical protein
LNNIAINRIYAVPHTNTFEPALGPEGTPAQDERQHGTSRFILCFIFALCERKNETQKEDKVPL